MKSKESSKSTKSPPAQKKKSSKKKKSAAKKKSAPPSMQEKSPEIKSLLFPKTPTNGPISGSSKIDGLRDQLKESQEKKKEPKAEQTEQERPPLPTGSLNVLLSLPFQIAGEQTGYYYEIPKRISPMMESMAEQIMADFGPEVAGKYINLAVFLGCYGHCFMQFRKGLKEHAEIIAAAAKKKEPKDVN